MYYGKHQILTQILEWFYIISTTTQASLVDIKSKSYSMVYKVIGLSIWTTQTTVQLILRKCIES